MNSDSGDGAKLFTFNPEWVFTLGQNRCSRSTRMTVHVGAEYALRSAVNDLTRALEYNEMRLQQLQHRAPGQKGRATDAEINAAKSAVKDKKAELDEVLKEFTPVQTEWDRLTLEIEKLSTKPIKIGNDLIKESLEKLRQENAELERLSQIIENSESDSPDTEALERRLEDLLSDRETVAALVATGEAPKSDFTQLESQITMVKKQLSEANSKAELAKLTVKGLGRKREEQNARTKAAANQHRQLITDLCNQSHYDAAKKINAALDTISEQLDVIRGCASISRSLGNGDSLIDSSSLRIGLDFGHIPGVDYDRLVTNEQRFDKIIEEFQRKLSAV